MNSMANSLPELRSLLPHFDSEKSTISWPIVFATVTVLLTIRLLNKKKRPTKPNRQITHSPESVKDDDSPSPYDVVIVGAGVAGSSLAYALGKVIILLVVFQVFMAESHFISYFL